VSAIFVRSHVKRERAQIVPLITEDEEDEVRKSKKQRDTGAGQPAIDPRTEQILREALEPSSVSPVSEPTVEWADESLQPARAERRKAASLAPVGVAETHYHQPAGDLSGDGWAEDEARDDEVVTDEPGETWASLGADSYNHLRNLMVDLPLKAGTAEVDQNLQEVAAATLGYYQYGLSQPGGDALPVGVTNGAQSSIREDIGILAGYLDLEKRFGRVPDRLDTGQAASHLMAALAGRALESGSTGTRGNAEFVRATVRSCLEGDPGASGGAPPGSRAGGEDEPNRLVYRRSRRSPGPGE
jgi:hypothetical protein